MQPSFKLISIGLFALALVVLGLVFTHKPKVVEKPVVTETNDHVVSDYVKKVELQTELERDAQQQVYMRQKMAKAKKESVECKFWEQQLAAKVTQKNKDKVNQFCVLADDGVTEAAASEVQTAQAK